EGGRGAGSLALAEQRGTERADQELGLGREAGDVEAGVARGVRARAEIDPRADVLQAGIEKGIVVGAMTVVADQRAAVTLGTIVVAAHVAVVDEEQRALRERLCERGDPAGKRRRKLRA